MLQAQFQALGMWWSIKTGFLLLLSVQSSGSDRYESNNNGNESVVTIEIRTEKGNKLGLIKNLI